MKDFIATILISLFVTAYGTVWSPVASEEGTPAGISFKRMGLYVVSGDLERSRAFYEKVFGQPPELATEHVLWFDVAGSLFSIVSKSAFAPEATLGGNVVPYIEVADLDAALAHLKNTVPEAVRDRTIIDEGVIKILKFEDPDGNELEYFWLPR